MLEIKVNSSLTDEYDAQKYIPKDILIGTNVKVIGINKEIQTLKVNENIEWILHVPCSDTNWKSHFESATLEELEIALKITEKRAIDKKGYKTKIDKLEKKILKQKKIKTA